MIIPVIYVAALNYEEKIQKVLILAHCYNSKYATPADDWLEAMTLVAICQG